MSKTFIELLKSEYLAAASTNRTLRRQFDEVSDALGRSASEVSLLERLLSAKGVDPKTLGGSSGAEDERESPGDLQQGDLMPESNGHGKLFPMSDTHAVFLFMRKLGNREVSIEELTSMAKAEGVKISPTKITQVIWRQIGKKFMEKTRNGMFRQTSEGEVFNGFRVQKRGKTALV